MLLALSKINHAPSNVGAAPAPIGAREKTTRGPDSAFLSLPPVRRLLTNEDICEAIAWRLRGVGDAERELLAALLGPFASDFREDRPEVAAVLRDLASSDKRGAWSMACAILADRALAHGEVRGAWAAGIEVVTAYRNSLRATGSRCKDALSSLILDYLARHSERSGPEIFDHFCALASPGHEILVDFDGTELTYLQNPPAEALRSIGEHAFCQRVSRLRITQAR